MLFFFFCKASLSITKFLYNQKIRLLFFSMFSEYLCTSPVNKRIVGWMRKEGLTGKGAEKPQVMEADRDMCKNLSFSCETFQPLLEHLQDSYLSRLKKNKKKRDKKLTRSPLPQAQSSCKDLGSPSPL